MAKLRVVEELLNSDYIAKEKGLFRPGHKVRLRSGGPVMIISKSFLDEGETKYECLWMNKQNEIDYSTFSSECLKFSSLFTNAIFEFKHILEYFLLLKSEEK